MLIATTYQVFGSMIQGTPVAPTSSQFSLGLVRRLMPEWCFLVVWFLVVASCVYCAFAGSLQVFLSFVRSFLLFRAFLSSLISSIVSLSNRCSNTQFCFDIQNLVLTPNMIQ